MCQASVTITKEVDEGDGKGYVKAPGWKFTTELSVPGGYKWVVPPPPEPDEPRTQTTNKDGVATFQWKPTKPNASSTVTITEDAVPGYEFVNYECTVSAPGQTKKRVRRGAFTGQSRTGVIKPNEYATCTVRNKKCAAPARLDHDRQGVGAAGPEGVQLRRHGAPSASSSSRTTASPRLPTRRPSTAPGRHLRRERGPARARRSRGARWEVDAHGHRVHDKSAVVSLKDGQVSIGLKEGGAVTCTFQNTGRRA